MLFDESVNRVLKNALENCGGAYNIPTELIRSKELMSDSIIVSSIPNKIFIKN